MTPARTPPEQAGGVAGGPLPPGTPVVDESLPPPQVRVVSYGPEGLEDRDDVAPGSLGDVGTEGQVTWIDVSGLGEVAALSSLAETLGLHRLVLEDIANTRHRPKVEVGVDEIFVVARRVAPRGERLTEQLTVILREGRVVTFQERPGPWADPIRRRIEHGRGLIRRRGPDYLAYALLDGAMDSFIPATEDLADELDRLDSQVMRRPTRDALARIHRLRRRLVSLRRHAVNQREAVSTLLRADTDLVQPETKTYLKDVLDHAQHVVEILDGQRETASSLMDLCANLIAQRLNEIMKVLTIIASVFIPLSFIAAVYGMNFDRSSPWNMPELGWWLGYPLVMGLMVAVAGAMLAAFWRRGWLGEGGTPDATDEEDP